MSRYLAAFLGETEKSDFSGLLVPNKSGKANNRFSSDPAAMPETAAEDFRLFRDIRNQSSEKTHFSEGAADRLGESANDTEADPDAAAERGAIQAEPALPPPGTPERAALDRQHVATVSAFLRVSLQRPPSWADPTARPSPGACCSCCGGRRWWCEIKCRRRQCGWRCWTCHPPDHLAAGDVECVTT